MPAAEDTFARLVSLAVHDLRTPLATASGFAKTLQRNEFDDPIAQYVRMMVAACEQLAELLDDLGIVARIEAGRWEPNLQEVDSRELVEAGAAPLGDAVEAGGSGATVRVDREAAERAVYALARCALRHGGLDVVAVNADGASLSIAPVTPEAAPVLMLEELRDLGAAVAARVVNALGGSIELDGERLVVRLPS